MDALCFLVSGWARLGSRWRQGWMVLWSALTVIAFAGVWVGLDSGVDGAKGGRACVGDGRWHIRCCSRFTFATHTLARYTFATHTSRLTVSVLLPRASLLLAWSRRTRRRFLLVRSAISAWFILSGSYYTGESTGKHSRLHWNFEYLHRRLMSSAIAILHTRANGHVLVLRRLP